MVPQKGETSWQYESCPEVLTSVFGESLGEKNATDFSISQTNEMWKMHN